MDTSTISLYDLGLDNRLDTRNDTVLMGDILQGTLSDALVVPEGKVEWVFVDSAKDNARLYTLSSYDLKRETAPLVVLTGEKDINDGTVRAVASTYMASAQQPFGEPANIGQLLFTTYLLPFQMVALLLLVAMIGAIILAHRDMIGSRQQKNVRRRVSRPLTSVISAQTGHDVLASQEADTPAGD
ncbi:MAG: NADH-quinone oxidoreductase subunit J [Anaerolineae bacterium]|nr:NADH-quinone oxidoreductase subunit J [Anaerolineae bacterium]